MASLLHVTMDIYNEILSIGKDPEIDTWMFMGSPVQIVLILSGYLMFVLKIGPYLMEKRPPFEIKKLLLIYNGFQVLFSFWLCMFARHVDNFPWKFFSECNFVSTNSSYALLLAECAWWYLFAKVVELLDTVFFVLRKKQSQVTFLHVYHHSCTLFVTWAYLKYFPVEQGPLIAFLNSTVHVVMYSYYFIAALGPQYQKFLWWKKYMTWMQLIQFCLMLAYLTYIIVNGCKLPLSLTVLFSVIIAFYVYLFGDFYLKTYKSRDKLKNVNNVKLE